MDDTWKKLIYIIVVAFLGVWLFYHLKRRRESPEKKIIKRLKSHFDMYVLRLSIQYPSDPRVIRLSERYKQTKLFESNTHETYTLNKGEEVVMCLRDYSKNKQIHDDFNLLIFVGLHELAHIMSVTTDHEPEFWANFKFILRTAAEMNMYDPVDYALDPVSYCAMIVHDNPYFYERTAKEFMTDIHNILQIK
jgi:hypothetical protein